MTNLYDFIHEIHDAELVPEVLNGGMSKEEKERTTAAALRKIHMAQEKRHPRKTSGLWRRRGKRPLLGLVAALVLIAAVTVSAYAAEYLRLGTIGTGKNKLTIAAREDSAKFKAREEFQEFLEREWGGKVRYGAAVIPPQALGTAEKEINRLTEKYGLSRGKESEDIRADSAEEAFSKAGIRNFLGGNQSLFKGENARCYYQSGERVELVNQCAEKGKRVYYDLICESERIADFYGFWKTAADEFGIIREWDFTTGEGIPVKAFFAKKESRQITLKNGLASVCWNYAEEVRGPYIWQSVLFAGDCAITLFISSTHKDFPFESEEAFQQMINQFDFSGLV